MTPTDDEIRALLSRKCGNPKPCDICDTERARVPSWLRQRYDMAMPLAEEVLSLRAENAKMRALIVDIDMRGIGHYSLCEGGFKGKDCPCGADDLQRRINEVTT